MAQKIPKFKGLKLVDAKTARYVQKNLFARMVQRWPDIKAVDYGDSAVRREICNMLQEVLVGRRWPANYQGAVQFKQQDGKWLMSVLLKPLPKVVPHGNN